MTPLAGPPLEPFSWRSTRARAAVGAVMASVLVVLMLCILLHAVQHVAWYHAVPTPVPGAPAVGTR